MISGFIGSPTLMSFFLGLMGHATASARHSSITTLVSCASQGISFSLIIVRVRQERHSRQSRHTSQTVGVPLPHRSHALDSLPHKQSDIA
jgi:hypothetical protein